MLRRVDAPLFFLFAAALHEICARYTSAQAHDAALQWRARHNDVDD